MKKILKDIYNKKFFFLFLIIIIILIILTVKFIIKKKSIKIGFVSTLSGAASTFTIQIRDVIILAVEEINQKGGIKGRPIELIIKDDKFDPDTALKVDQELINEGVVAIIGHSFSSLCIKVAPLLKKNNILMLTPTAQSPELTGLDDNFIRFVIPIDKIARAYAIIAAKKLNLKKICIVYDMINPGLAIPSFNYFKDEFEKYGGKISTVISFNSKEKFSVPVITKKIMQSGVDGVYIISDAIHTALICQHLKMNNLQLNILVHGWASGDPTFIKEGGQAVEGVIGTKPIDLSLANEKFLSFEKKFIERFGYTINGPALSGYESINILLYALSKTTDPKKLKKTILMQKIFDGIDGKITFDKYGDPTRALLIMQIQDGKAVKIDKIEVEEFLTQIN